MKGVYFLIMYLTVESATADSSRGRFSFSRFRNARLQEGTSNGNSYGPPTEQTDSYGPPTQQTESYGPPTEQTESPSGPYPPSGWKPSGDLLLVPGETHSSQQQEVDSTYGPPPPPPDSQYGAASKPTTTTTTTTTTEPTTTTTTTESGCQDPDGCTQTDSDNKYPGENGQYYVLLPDGKLQKIRYSGKKKGRGQYEAQVEYEVVDPIRSPIYAYQGVPLNFNQPRRQQLNLL